MYRRILSSLVLAGPLAACSGAEAPIVELPVIVSSIGLVPAVTDLGYEVSVTRYRVALRDVELSIGGETHQSAGPPAARSLAGPPGGPLPDPGHPVTRPAVRSPGR